MMTDQSISPPPLNLRGAALWFGRNFLEALIWASAGAFILVLLLAARSFPTATVGAAVSVVVVGILALRLFSALRPAASVGRTSVLQFDLFRLRIKVIVGARDKAQADRP